MKDKVKEVALITDDIVVAELISELLDNLNGNGLNIQLKEINTPEQAEDALTNENYNIFLLDNHLSGKPTLPLLQKSMGFGLKSPVIFLHDKNISEKDIELVEGIATDYLDKTELTARHLADSIWHSIEKFELLNKLFEKQIRYQSLFEYSMEAIFMCKPNKQIAEVNTAMRNLMNFEKERFKNLHIKNLFFDENDYLAFINELDQTNTISNFKTTLKGNNNVNPTCLLTIMALLDSEGSIQGYQGVAHDISAQERSRMLLNRSERLAMTARLIRSLAHEVRNPLTNVYLALEQLKNETKDNDSAKSYIDIIGRSANKINDLISKLLESSEATKLKFSKKSVHMLLDKCLDLASDRLQLQETDLKKEYYASPDEIEMDKDKLQIALLNIIMNAIEATEKGEGSITLTTMCVNGNVQIIIRDNGTGMDDKQLDHLFDPFYTGKQNGIGLGLTTSQNIITGHDGAIDVISKLDVGTEFIITLPVDVNRVHE